ncbi:hypothetical protein ABIA39_002412 [Nocardia sp. GAS34]
MRGPPPSLGSRPMALLVHLTPEKNARRIRRAGIAASGSRKGVFCLPVMPSYVLSHQWLRELRRGGQRLIVAVDFRIRDDERVLVGHYSADQVEMRVAEAVSVILHAEDARGYEILVPRAIAPAELHRVRHVRQVTGWRYRPNAHGQRPCVCPVCLGRGEFKAADLRRRFATEPPELTKPQLLGPIAQPGLRRRSDRRTLRLGSQEPWRRRRRRTLFRSPGRRYRSRCA